MAVDHFLQHITEVGEGLDIVELCGLDEGVDGGPTGAAAVRASKQMVLAAERYLPFIPPMSGKSWESIIDGTRILVARCAFAASRNGRLAGF